MNGTTKRLIEQEMKQAYLDYSMSVIMGRALPDVHDGLKPIHRRILYTMHQLGLLHNKPFRKSSNVVGTCMARYHPHGDAAIYDSLVRMAQNFSLRYPLIEGQGNFGSVDGDSAAAQRYTEARLSIFAEEMLADIEKNTVKFVDNYDGKMQEPKILPARLPNLLINGSSGIAVGMATNVPPHNLTEVCDAIIALIDNKNLTTLELMSYIKGPDFPTGGIILGQSGILKAYNTGRGKILVRGKTNFEEKGNRNRIIVTEIPYMVNKSLLIESIADLVKDKRIEGISDIRDESDRKGMRIVIEIKQGHNSELILNNLYKHTNLQVTFGINMLALIAGEPRVLRLKKILIQYLAHRRRVITRRTEFELKKAEDRAHILEGLKIALSNIDEVVDLIKKSKDVVVAKDGLMNKFELSEEQAKAILEMRLSRLTSLETEKIISELEELRKIIKELKLILASEERIYGIIRDEVLELKRKYGDGRRTEIVDYEMEVEDEDLIKQEDVVITMTHQGYIKRIPLETYKAQGRGGKGIIATTAREEDFVEELFITNTHNYLMFFTDKGKVYWLKAYNVAEASRYGKGSNIVNLLRIDKDEKLNAIISVKEFNDNDYLIMGTKKGLIKKTKLIEYSRPRKGGILAINLREGDELINVKVTRGNDEIIIATRKGMAVRFNEEKIRAVGRNSMGVRGVKLINDEVVGVETCNENDSLLTVTENGYGKRSKINEYRLINRGGKGVINIKATERNGNVVGIEVVNDVSDIMFISKKGIIIRTSVKNISEIGRNTQGVRLMKLSEGDKVVSLARVVSEE